MEEIDQIFDFQTSQHVKLIVDNCGSNLMEESSSDEVCSQSF